MTDLRKAAQQALEALKNAVEHLPVHFDDHFEAIETLKIALAQPEPIISTEIKANKTQPEQEPVAWQWLGTSVIRKRIPKTAEADDWEPLYAAFSQHKPFTLQAKCSSCDQPLGGLEHIHTCSPQRWWPVFQRAELSDSEGGEQ